MDCRGVLDRMLEAEPSVLAGEGDSPLARHLRECARCSAVAARLLAGQAEIARALDRMEPRLSPDKAVETARVGRRRSARRGAIWLAAAPLAAAAAVTAVLLLRTSPMPEPDAARPTTGVSVESPPMVQAPAGRNVVVFKTSDPSITVVWFY